VTALVSVKIAVFWEVALLFGRLVDIDVSEEPPASMLWVEGARSEQKNKWNFSHSRLFMYLGLTLSAVFTVKIEIQAPL
jgi:hypothetical protein